MQKGLEQRKHQVWKGEDLPNLRTRIKALKLAADLSAHFQRKYDLNFRGFFLLVKICSHWEVDQTGITVYAMSETPTHGDDTANAQKVALLLQKGLIEFIGISTVGRGRLYGPTVNALRELSELGIMVSGNTYQSVA